MPRHPKFTPARFLIILNWLATLPVVTPYLRAWIDEVIHELQQDPSTFPFLTTNFDEVAPDAALALLIEGLSDTPDTVEFPVSFAPCLPQS